MKIKEIRQLKIEVLKDNETLYIGNSNEAPDDIKVLDCKNITFIGKALKIQV